MNKRFRKSKINLRAALLVVFITSFVSIGIAKEKKLEILPFEEIIKNYSIVSDFSVREPTRPISKEIFWRYPLFAPQEIFPLEFFTPKKDVYLPATPGDSRAIEHINKGRKHFAEGQIEEAKNVWLTGRAKFGTSYLYHRRNDYFISLSFLNAFAAALKKNQDIESPDVKMNASNAATFLSWAFIVKKNDRDTYLDEVTPQSLYNLAAIYYNYNQLPEAIQAAEDGLKFLEETGKKEYRAQFRRILAEIWIRKGDYLKAVQELDISIRQDVDPDQAARSFARIGDIYFDINNYELAEDMYSISNSILSTLGKLKPIQYLLQGESLFWLGRFSEAQRVIQFALDGYSNPDAIFPSKFVDYTSWGKLRIADAYLARFAKEVKHESFLDQKNHPLLDKARLAYYQVQQAAPKTEASYIAQIRRSCLELPFYQGKNTSHARDLLKTIEKKEVSLPAIELAYACNAGSYTFDERNPEMFEEIKKYALKYPESSFLASLLEPVKHRRRLELNDYLKADDPYMATVYYETMKDKILKKPTDEEAFYLFRAYVDTGRSPKALEFWPSFKKSKIYDDLDHVRKAVFLSEFLEKANKKIKLPYVVENLNLSKKLLHHTWGIKKSELSHHLLLRIRNTTSGLVHIPWMIKFALLEKGIEQSCHLVPNLISQWLDVKRPINSDKEIKGYVNALVLENLPVLLEKDKPCAQRLLDLEEKAFLKNPRGYASLWLNRISWPKNQKIINHIWNAAEIFNKIGEKEKAKKLFTVIAEQKSSDYPEVKYAQLRLTPDKTEYESLWEN